MNNCQWNNCFESFASADKLKAHIDIVHIDSDGVSFESAKPTYLCRWTNCSKSTHVFAHRYRLVRHVGGVHCKSKSHKCDQCPKAFSYVEGLRDHKRVHTGEKPFKCRVAGCELFFRTSSDRVKHQRSHQLVQFDCPTCDYICHTKITLSRHHKRVHGSKLPASYSSKQISTMPTEDVKQAEQQPKQGETAHTTNFYPIQEQREQLEAPWQTKPFNMASTVPVSSVLLGPVDELHQHSFVQYDPYWHYQPLEQIVPQMDAFSYYHY